MARKLAVVIARTFPDAQRREMRRPPRRHMPLVHGVIGNAVDADLAVRPGLRACPFDAIIKVFGFARRPHFEISGRATGATGIDAHNGIAVGHPLLGINQLPVLILVARALQRFGKGFHQPHPRALVCFRKGKTLGVRPIAEDDGILAVSDRPKDIGAQQKPVVHLDRGVPIDAHAVADFGFHRMHVLM
jgi:hypothetical protein